jgi:prepilin-type processing-associated H-X9-DG protein
LLTGFGWAAQTMPYTKSAQIYKCPSDSTAPTNGYTLSYAYAWGVCRGDSYGISGKLVKFNDVTRSVMIYEVNGMSANISDPLEGGTGTNLSGVGVGDTLVYNGWTTSWTTAPAKAAMGENFGLPDNYNTFCLTTTRPCIGRHFEGGNYLLADGHIKWYKPTSVSIGYTALGENNAFNGGLQLAEGTGVKSRAITFSPI